MLNQPSNHNPAAQADRTGSGAAARQVFISEINMVRI